MTCVYCFYVILVHRLILLVLEAGIDVDLTTLRLIGSRGFVIAIVGSVLPIMIGMILALALQYDMKTSIAAGAAFGPTSLGIAMNILRQGKLVNTPVGQLIISAAVIDDMIALIILSQLSALTGDVDVVELVLPIVSAFLFLGLGGYIAIAWAPIVIDKYILCHVTEEMRPKTELAIMLGLLFVLMPATYESKASFLMGAFISGLAFCRSNELHHTFVRQFKRILQWLMRIFFAASIGFQVPLEALGDGTVIWQGLVFTLALSGKIAVGFLVPNFNNVQRFKDTHLRDCLITGFSMAAEGEFAFVIAVFAVDEGIISVDLYASIVMAVLLSTIVPPFLLRFTIAYYNKKAEEKVAAAATKAFSSDDNRMSYKDKEDQLRKGILNDTTVFLCIQTQSESSWGLLTKLITTMQGIGIEVIDHRSWHPRGIDSTLVNEVFVRYDIKAPLEGKAIQTLNDKTNDIRIALEKTINQPEAKVKVSRWFPGVLQEIKEEVEETTKARRTSQTFTATEAIMKEAANQLERNRLMQTTCTKEKTVDEILREAESATGIHTPVADLEAAGGVKANMPNDELKQRRPRRIRQKMRSTPVVGGGLFEDQGRASQANAPSKDRMSDVFLSGNNSWQPKAPKGEPAEIVIKGEVYKIRLAASTIERIRSGYNGSVLNDSSIKVDQADVPIEYRLEGFVRSEKVLATVAEDTEMSDTSSHLSTMAGH